MEEGAMALTDDDIARIRELIREEIRASQLPSTIPRADLLSREVIDHIEMVIMTRLVHAISTRRVGK